MQQKRVYESLFRKTESGVIVLFDPDRTPKKEAIKRIDKLNKIDLIKAYFIGTSFQMTLCIDEYVRDIKNNTNLPVIMFPSDHAGLSKYADAMLFMSLLSGRNPQFLVEEQLKMVPFIINTGIEVIPTGYILVDGGKITSVEFMTNTKPIPRDKPDLVINHAKVGELFGFNLIYLEAGSGAKYHVPFELIKETSEFVNIPVIVGGGFKTLPDIEKALKNGAKHVVVGTQVEKGKLFV